MIDRRDLLKAAAIGSVAVSATRVSACSYAEFEDDNWGVRIVEFLKTGSKIALDGLFQDFSTLVAFDPTFMASNQLHFEGRLPVEKAVRDFRNSMLEERSALGRHLAVAKIVGNGQQGRMNRIELTFANRELTYSSCGESYEERRVDLLYEAGVYETGYDWVRWAVQRLAIVPPLDLERFDG